MPVLVRALVYAFSIVLMILGVVSLALAPIAYRSESQFRRRSMAAEATVANVRERTKNGSTIYTATIHYDDHGTTRTAEVDTDEPAQVGGQVPIRFRGGDARSVDSLSSPSTVLKAFGISGLLLLLAGSYGYYRSRKWMRPNSDMPAAA